MVAEGFDVRIGSGTADGGGEGGEENLDEGIINRTRFESRVADFVDGKVECGGNLFDFAPTIILLEGVNKSVFRCVGHDSSVSEKRSLTIAHT